MIATAGVRRRHKDADTLGVWPHEPKNIDVQPSDADAMRRSLEAGARPRSRTNIFTASNFLNGPARS